MEIKEEDMSMYYYSLHTGHNYMGGMITFFRSKNALSPENAVQMEKIDWYSVGIMGNPETTFFGKSTYPYIKKTNDGKYWLDISALEKHIEWSNRFVKGLIFFSIFFGILFVIIGIVFGI